MVGDTICPNCTCMKSKKCMKARHKCMTGEAQRFLLGGHARAARALVGHEVGGRHHLPKLRVYEKHESIKVRIWGRQVRPSAFCWAVMLVRHAHALVGNEVGGRHHLPKLRVYKEHKMQERVKSCVDYYTVQRSCSCGARAGGA